MEEKNHSNEKKSISRRNFLTGTATTAAAFTIVPRHVLGGTGFISPSDKVNLGCVGVGGKGRSDTFAVSKGNNVVALCDVDDLQMAGFEEACKKRPESQGLFDKAKKYRDFRKMLDKEKNIDAITVSTPDHNHAVIAMTAIKMGKHTFVQKPLTHTIYEARALREAAKKYNVVTQMGNQGHAGEGARLINEWIWDGAIGDVRTVHTWTNRPIWPQGIERPKEIPSCPSTLDWDVWLGPAPFRPYHPAYAPFSWRGWWEYGTGAIGDMGAHIIDQPFWALNLGAPKTVQASSTKFTDASYPLAEVVTYEFPARGKMPPVTLTWSDGGIMPPRPLEIEDGRMLGEKGGGVLFHGDKGSLMCSVYGGSPRLIPESKMRDYQRPEKKIPRSPGIHEEWIEAIRNGKKSTTDFSYASALTEMMLLGNVAVLMKDHNMKLEWDSTNLQFTNLPEANEHIHTKYRPGWSL